MQWTLYKVTDTNSVKRACISKVSNDVRAKHSKMKQFRFIILKKPFYFILMWYYVKHTDIHGSISVSVSSFYSNRMQFFVCLHSIVYIRNRIAKWFKSNCKFSQMFFASTNHCNTGQYPLMLTYTCHSHLFLYTSFTCVFRSF